MNFNRERPCPAQFTTEAQSAHAHGVGELIGDTLRISFDQPIIGKRAYADFLNGRFKVAGASKCRGMWQLNAGRTAGEGDLVIDNVDRYEKSDPRYSSLLERLDAAPGGAPKVEPKKEGPKTGAETGFYQLKSLSI